MARVGKPKRTGPLFRAVEERVGAEVSASGVRPRPRRGAKALLVRRLLRRLRQARPGKQGPPGGPDSPRLREQLGERSRRERGKNLVERMWDGDFSEVLARASRRRPPDRIAHVHALKGLYLELSLREPVEAIRRRCEAKIAALKDARGDRVLGVGPGWHPRAFVARGVLTDVPGGGKAELADYIVYAVTDSENPTKIWIMAIVESKAQHNGRDLVSYKSEWLGQLEMDLERIDIFGLDLPGSLSHQGVIVPGTPGKHVFDRSAITVGFNRKNIPITRQMTELIAFIPEDSADAVRKKVERSAEQKGIQLDHHPLRGADAEFLAEQTLILVPGRSR